MLLFRKIISTFTFPRNGRLRQLKINAEMTSKLLFRRVNRLHPIGRLAVFIAIFISALSLIMLLFSSLYNIGIRSSLLERHKCPACYGFKACDKLIDGDIKLTSASNLFGIFSDEIVKYHGKTKENMQVILSKLGSKSETSHWESKICSKTSRAPKCDVSKAAQMIFPLSGSKWMLNAIKGFSLMTTCPTDRLLNSMQFRYTETLDAIDMSARERTQMVLTLWRSQEPLIYQTFSKELGWPFPKYLGACGRVVVYESPGEALYGFVHESWILRTKLALEILKIAHKMTHNPSKYGLYMLQANFSTFHVKRETGEVFYTSPNDIIVVDRWQIEQDKKNDWDKSLIRESSPCRVLKGDPKINCIPSENWNGYTGLCSQHYSDHNFYIVCRNILSPVTTNGNGLTPVNVGLLRNIPRDIDILFGLNNLINLCSDPPSGTSREEIVSRLIKVLESITNDLDTS